VLIRYGFDIDIYLPQPTPVITMMDVHTAARSDILREESLRLSQSIAVGTSIDTGGNVMRRFDAAAGPLCMALEGIWQSDGSVDVVDPGADCVPVGDLPIEILPFLRGSRYCETDLLSDMAWRQFGDIRGGWAKVQAICDFVQSRLWFNYQNARATRTAAQAFDEGTGVCRDFAHLAITLCRALNVPARYCNGYLGDIGVPPDPAPMDFNAWFEVYLSGRWFTFDARHNQPRIGRILIARGRDAMDIPMLTTFGPHMLNRFSVTTEEMAPALKAA
jgi:transglutaminase-like putative cysteine protease